MKYLIAIILISFTALVFAKDNDKTLMTKDKTIIYTNTTAKKNGIIYTLKTKSKVYELVKKAKVKPTK